MPDYHISRIFPDDKREIRKLDALLQKEGIGRDRNLDYIAGLYDEDYHLAATGSCFGNTLRCMAVDSERRGEGLLNQIVSHLIEYEYGRGLVSLFLYTKCDKAMFFRDLGFYEIARVEGRVVFMENRKNGFHSYLDQLRAETGAALSSSAFFSPARPRSSAGAVVMNANPFTLGHQYLLEKASESCAVLHVFIVSEDVSLVPLKVRFDLVRKGTAHLKNLVFHQTGSYMISNATFPSYFLRDEDTVIRSHAKLDLAVFQRIAQALSITDRFVGEEPNSQVTGIYNQIMAEDLREAGIACHVIPRRTGADGVISASTVRRRIQEGELSSIRDLVPETTYRYFVSLEAEPVIAAIRREKDVMHY